MNLEFETSDWSEVFRLAHLKKPTPGPGLSAVPNLWPGNVARVLAKTDGSNFGDSWAILVQTWDRTFYTVVGVCNVTTGDGCDEWTTEDCIVDVFAAKTAHEALRLGMGDSERSRLGDQVNV